MSLVGVEMVFFLPAVLALYWLAPRRAGVQNLILLLASAVFYVAWSKAWFAWLLVAATLDWWIGLRLGALRRPADAEGSAEAAQLRRRRRVLLGLSLVANVGLLGGVKYLGASVELLSDLLARMGLGLEQRTLSILLPLGLSYATLIKLGYVIDVYWGRRAPERSWLSFALFSTFFAHITAGPISRADEFLPQVAQARRPDPAVLARGAGAFLFGFVLKGLSANVLGRWLVDPVFADPGAYSAPSCWLAVGGFSLQIFCDFAGYSLLAIGTAGLLGIALPENFRLPFLSRSLPEFWRRWHITLNQWLFDYIYNPLVTGHGAWRGRFVPGLIVVFVISGLWHGSQWTFALWGLLHGIGMAVQFRWDELYKGLCRKDRRWVARRRSATYALAAWALTQAYFVVTLIPFKAATLGQAGALTAGLFGAGGELHIWNELRASLDRPDKLAFVLAIAIPVAWHVLGLPQLGWVERLARRVPAPLRGVAYGLVVVSLLVLVPVGASTFIYRNF